MEKKSKFKKTEIGMIPKDWGIDALSNVIELIGGGTPKTSRPEYWNGKIPWISVVDFAGGKRWVYDTEKHITEKGLNDSSTQILHKGQIVISARGTVGELGQVTRDMAFNQSCYGINAKNNTTNDFLYYMLKYKLRDLLSKTHGSVFSTITRQTFEQISILLPPLPEQKRIAKILSDLDSKIELLQTQNKTLEAIGQALFKRWFVDFEFPTDKGPYKSSGGKMIDSELGKIPEGWRVKKLGECVEFAYGKGLPESKRQNGNYPVLGSNGIIGFHSDFLVKGPGIVIGRKGTLGEVYWVEEDFFPIDTTFYIVDKLNLGTLHFYYFALKGKEFLKASSDSAVPGLNRNIAYSNTIIIPRKEILSKFNTICTALFYKKNNLLHELRTLSQTRDSLLPKLMSGKIRVPVMVIKK